MLPPNADLFEFLSSHGVSLADVGSAERALSAEHAVSFARMLQAHGFSPVGIEVWRRQGNAWRIDSTGGWFVDELDPEEAVSDAILFLGEVDAAESTSFTVQF